MNLPVLLHSRYEIAERIGHGGTGIVYRGHDRHTTRTVAIKTLRTDAADWQPDALERFRREAELLRQLNHPNIIQVVATLEQDAQTYIVMEYADGGSLNDLLRREHPLPIGQVLSIALDIADALTRVHRLGVLHRDLKPANVLLTTDGGARLGDFGIAYLAGGKHLTHDGGTPGTPQYLSPEALGGEALDARSDIWAFGAVLFEMLTGNPPFDADAVARIVMQVMTQPVPDLEALRPDAPVALVDLVYRMLEKDPASRLRSVRLAGAELEALLNIVPWEARPAGIASATGDAPAEPSPFTSGATKVREGPPHNLPAQTTPLVGRREELDTLARLLGESRLVTVVGVGGSGKTRIALELGSEQRARFDDGTFFVPLAPLGDVGEVVTAIADAVGLTLLPGIPRDQQLIGSLRDRNMLLILDNFEHLLDGSALASAILDAAPAIRIVTTSREPLGVGSETLLRLDGVDVPPGDTPTDRLASYGAVELFLQAARRAHPAFKPDGADLDAIAAVSRFVGGLPLAISLAASWVELLSPSEILNEVRRDIDFLDVDAVSADARHRSMRAVFDATWERLDVTGQEQLARLAVFRGGFTRQAAQEVAGASLRSLATLVRHSLLQRDPASGRYAIHELLRQYAEQRLAAANLRDDAEARHGAWYADVVHALEGRLGAPDQRGALAELDADLDNIRAAWDSAVRRSDLGVIGKALSGLATFYGLRTMNEEACARIGAALSQVQSIPEGVRPLDLELGLQVRSAVAQMNLQGYGHPDVGAGFMRAHELCEQLGPSPMLAPVMFGLWAFYIIGANHARAAKLAGQLLEIGEHSGDAVLAIGGHHASSGSCVAAGDLRQAAYHATRVMELYRPEYDPQIVAWFADHSASASRGWHAAALDMMGQFDRAAEVERDMRAFIERLAHGQTHAQGLMFIGMHAVLRRELDRYTEINSDLTRIAQTYGLPVYAVFSQAFQAFSNPTPEARPAMAQAIATVRDGFGFKAMTVGTMVLPAAHAALAAGDTQAARGIVEDSLTWIRECGERIWEAEALRLRGECELATGDSAAAERSLCEAIDAARSCGARTFELRAVCALHRIWRGTEREAESRNILQPLFESMTEGRDLADLREAADLVGGAASV